MSQCRRSKWDFATPVTGKLADDVVLGPLLDKLGKCDTGFGHRGAFRESCCAKTTFAKSHGGRPLPYEDPALVHHVWGHDRIRASGARSHASVRHRAFSPPRSVVADRFRPLARILNRVAHHEHIFSRAREADHKRCSRLPVGFFQTFANGPRPLAHARHTL